LIEEKQPFLQYLQAFQFFLRGCLFAFTTILSSLLSNFDANGVFLKEGAIALPRMVGANSVASDFVSP
jgi:hypothetical protein